jgi:hypothetical protein
LDLRVGGSTVEELLIRVHKPLLANKVPVVVVLEYGWGLKVQRSQIVVT